MKYLYLFITLIFVTPLFSSAQSNYKSGYLITLKGDTVNGFINYKDWDKNPKVIDFKSNLEDNKTEYSVRNIVAFTINGYEKYKRFNLWISQDYVDHEKLVQWLDTTVKFDTVFLRTVTTGKNLTLYAYKDKIKPRFFISDMGSEPVELGHHIYLDTTYATVVHIKDTYKIQLQKLTATYKPGDQKLIDHIQLGSYNEDNLSDIVYRINGSPDVQKAALTRNAPRFFAGISINSFSSSFKVGSDATATTTTATSTFAPGLDLGIDVYTNKNVGRWILRLDVSAIPNSVNISYKTTQGTASTTDYVLKFKQFTPAFTPQLIYNLYNSDTFKLYLDAGVGVGVNVNLYSSKQYTGIVTYTVSGTSGSGKLQMPNLQFLTFDVPVKIGVVINKNIDIYAGLNPKMRLDDDSDYQVNQTSITAGMHYFFGR